MIVEGDSGSGIEHAAIAGGVEVRGDDLVLGVSEDALQGALGSLLNYLLDVVVLGCLLETAGQVDDGDVGGRHTERHASQLAVEDWDDLADSLGSSSG